MSETPIVHAIFLIFFGAAVFGTMALYARLALLVSYMLLGVLLGPFGFALVDDAEWLADVGEIGIMFLLYLLGMNLQPGQLWRMLGEALGVTIASCIAFALMGYVCGRAFGFSGPDSLLFALAMMFSSTIIGLKLLPTTTLHHRHTGQVIISVLLLQDLLAIIAMLMLQGYGKGGGNLAIDIARQLLILPLLGAGAFAAQRYLLEPLMRRFDQIHEYIFLLVIAWCLGIAELARFAGLSSEIGAFIAGVALASSPIALFIAESLKPLRDFFMVLFFFSLGAGFDLGVINQVLMPALVLAGLAIAGKPFIFRQLLVTAGEKPDMSLEVGVRLGQISEFSLLVAVVAVHASFVSEQASYVVQLAVLMTFIVSSYFIVARYPTPVAMNERLRRD